MSNVTFSRNVGIFTLLTILLDGWYKHRIRYWREWCLVLPKCRVYCLEDTKKTPVLNTSKIFQGSKVAHLKHYITFTYFEILITKNLVWTHAQIRHPECDVKFTGQIFRVKMTMRCIQNAVKHLRWNFLWK